MSATRTGQCEERPGIGLCDDCGKPNWPQEYIGYGLIICLDCANRLATKKKAAQEMYSFEPAHSVPFASSPGRIVTETFTLTIETPEQPDYCGCQYCKNQREKFLRSIIEAQLRNFFHGRDPFFLFPNKQAVSAVPMP